MMAWVAVGNVESLFCESEPASPQMIAALSMSATLGGIMQWDQD